MDEAAQVATREKLFSTSWEHERPGIPASLDAMVEANADDALLCNWLQTCRVGAEYRVGGGASPLCVIRRVA